MKKKSKKPRAMAKRQDSTMTREHASNASSPKGATQSVDDRFAPGELPRISDADPVVIRTVIKLDQRSMVWAYEGVATDVEALSPFFAILIGGVVGACLFFMWDIVFGTLFSGEEASARIWLFAISLLFAVGGSWFVYFILKNSIFSAFGDLHFNRRSGTIYTAENKTSVRMNWANVRPYAIANFGQPQLGAPIMMSLQLVEFASPDSKTPMAHLVVAGPLPSRKGCQEVWELIRRYMEDPPERLPPLEVASGNRDWIGVLLTFGPMSFGTIPQEFLAKLRARNWWPPINPFRMGLWIIAWYFPLSVTLYNRYRRRAKLPLEWTKDEIPPVSERNPYQTSVMDPKDAAGRRKAAWIIGIVSGLCISIGIYLYSLGVMVFIGR